MTARPLPSYRTSRGIDPLRLALALWLALGAAVTVRVLVRPASHSVFPIFALSSVHWWQDLPLYVKYPPLDYFRYPPVCAVALTPLSALGLRAGGVLWSWLGLAVLLLGLQRYARAVMAPAWTRRALALFLALAALGALRGLWNAQSNALVVGLLLLAGVQVAQAAGSEQERNGTGRDWWLAAVLLAVAVWVKLTPLVPALLLCALWPRQLAGRFLVVLAAGGLLPFLTRPPAIVVQHYHDWLDHLTTTAGDRWLGFRDGWTVWLALEQMITGQSGPLPLREALDSLVYRVVQVFSGLAVLAWCLWQQRRGLGPRLLTHVSLSMGMGWLMLFGPATEHATYVFLTPALCWGLVERDAWPRGRRLIGAAFVLVMILGWGALTRPLEPVVPLLVASLPLGAALFMAWLVGYAGSIACEEPTVSTWRDRQEIRKGKARVPHLPIRTG
jgi:hypothetical protein